MKFFTETRYILLGILLMTSGLFGCKKDKNESSGPVAINAVYLQNVNSDVKDRKVEFARLGQTIRIEGTGFMGVQQIYVNGYKTSFNPALMTDNNIWLSIGAKTPTLDADPEKRNTIIMEKNGQQTIYSFEIRSSAPSISSVSHTMPKAGEKITIYGSGLQAIQSVTFPGNIVVTEGIESDDVDGKYCTVIVPANVSADGGALLLLGANGGAYSPAYFNFKKGLLHNFDDVNTQSWSQGRISDDLDVLLPGSGNGPKSQGKYRSLNKDGEVINASDALVDVTRYWINNGVWASKITNEVIPAATPTDQVAIQMDIYVAGDWNSGNIRFVVADGFGASRYALLYAPWESNGARVPFVNPGSWFTITLPFSGSADFKDKTFGDVLTVISTVTYAQAGPWLENGPINGVVAQPTNVNIYFDNIRIVPLNKPVYSDFD
ncbi:glycan-binding surface protein [Pseudopedobacter beijingensis]|uniref:Glycan-binding surface protein n=1 Tax=Pseudopedobacter beijingensis TaxID=1207056 RepID=A0ABW4I7Y0_9SPHI